MIEQVAALPDGDARVYVPSSVRRIAACLAVIAVIGAAAALLQLAGLSRSAFHTKGEPREAVVVQDLVRRGDWVLPQRAGVNLPRKPPLFYWLGGVVAKARGVVDEAGVRLPSAILSGIACAAIATLVTVLYGGVAGAVSGLALLTSFEWERAATTARVDMALAFGLTIAFAGLLAFRRVERRAWLLLFYAGVTWATLSKGIPGLAIPAFQIVLLCIVDRSPAFALRLRPIVGVAVVLLISGAWYAAAAAQGGAAFLTIVFNENLVRVVGERGLPLGHRHSIPYLSAALLGGLLPWTVLLPSTALALWRERRTIDRWDPRLFALLWIVAVFTPHAIAASKRGVYLLPLYPAVCLLVGWWAAALLRGTTPARWLPRVLAPLAWVLAALLALLAIVALGEALGAGLLETAAQLTAPRTARDLALVAAAPAQDWITLAVCLALAASAAVALACGAGARRWGIAFAALLCCTAAVTYGVRMIVLPALAEGETPRHLALALRRVVPDPADLHTGPSFDYGTLFYWGEPMPVYDPASASEPPDYLLATATVRRRMSPALRQRYRPVPGLPIEPGGDQGYAALLQRIDEGTQRTAD